MVSERFVSNCARGTRYDVEAGGTLRGGQRRTHTAPNFCATVFADNIGHARHLVVAPNGVVYVNTWSGRYYANDPPPPPGGFLVALQDTTGDGRADVTIRFGDTREQGSAGGTGIALYKGGLFAEMNDRIVCYALPAEMKAPSGPPEVILSGLPLTDDHPMHPFAIDARGGGQRL